MNPTNETQTPVTQTWLLDRETASGWSPSPFTTPIIGRGSFTCTLHCATGHKRSSRSSLPHKCSCHLALYTALAMARSRIVLGSLTAFCVILSFKLVACGKNLAEENHKAAITTEEHIDEKYGYYDGDLILTDWQKEILGIGKEENESGKAAERETQAHTVDRRAVVNRAAYLWPDGVVHYVLDRSLNSAAERAIRSAMREFEDNTCIRFVKRTSQNSYIRFLKDRGCYSYIGRTGAAGQAISIGIGCEYKGIVIHEIFHALGRWHEQSRPDRDDYIVVNYDNIINSVTNNFKRLSDSVTTTQDIKYDLRSIMHYDAYAFSKNGRPTIEPKSSRIKLSNIGQREDFTASDLQHVNRLYDCPNQPPGGNLGSWGSWQRWSSCSATCGGGLQTRRRTCVDSGCTGQSRQSRSCNTRNCPLEDSWGPWGAWSSCSSTCGGGQRSRTRACRGSGCVGSKTQRRSCNTRTCPTTSSSGWGPWGKWTPCAATCGGGLKFRWRRCLSPSLAGCRSGRSYELEPCGPKRCPSGLASPTHDGVVSRNKTALSHNGAKHSSCQQLTMSIRRDRLFLSSHEIIAALSLISGPLPADKVKGECFHHAQSLNLSYVGIMGEYCISIINSDLSNVASTLTWQMNGYDVCKNGTGLYNPSSRVQYMDVYSVGSEDTVIPESPSDAVRVKPTLVLINSGTSSAIRMGLIVIYIIAGILTLVLS